MPIIQPKISVPDNIYREYLMGNIDIMGLAKNATNGQIIKHLNVVETMDDSKDNNAAIIAGLVAAGITTVAVGTTLIVGKFNKKKITRFTNNLNIYVAAVNNQNLTTEIIDNLIDSLDNIKHLARKKLKLSFSSDELIALVECLCNHTQNLAMANDKVLKFNYSEEENKDMLLRLRRNLVEQKKILQAA